MRKLKTGHNFYLGYAPIFLPQSSDLVRRSSGQVSLGIPNKPDFIRLPKGKADKIIACGVNLQKILDNMGHSLFFLPVRIYFYDFIKNILKTPLLCTKF